MIREPRDTPVFISFATPDGDTARRICDALEARGFRCWISLRDLETGSRYGDEIVRQIERSEALVVVLSRSANESEFVHREVERAVNYRVPVFPVRIEEVAPGRALELFISAQQWIDVWSGDFSDQMDRLARDLDRRRRRGGGGATPAAGSGAREAPARTGHAEAARPERGGRRWIRRYGGLALAAAVVAVFGVLNLSRSGVSSTASEDAAGDTSSASTFASASNPSASGEPEAPGRPDAPDPTDEAGGETGSSPVPRDRVAPDDPAGAGPTGEAPAARPASGVLVAVYGDAGSGAETVESILLGELAERGHASMDRVTLDATSASSPVPVDAEQLGILREHGGVALVIAADLRTEATPSVGAMYTGRATLSVRIYDTEARRLVGTHTFQVGAGGTPGKIGASPMAASNEAVRQVAHQAATGLARELRRLASP